MRLWGDDGKQLRADDLVGLPEDGKFCDPTSVYSNAFTWGPTDEIIVFFNEETRLVEAMMAYQSYLGSMKGQVKIGNKAEDVVVKPRERIQIGGKELDQYTGRDQQGERTNSWLNDANITKICGMIRQQFFGSDPLPEGFNCVEAALCDVIYTAADESVPQDTFLDFQDSGVQLRFTPEGQVTFVYLQPVRIAQFEVAGGLTMGDAALAPTYTSTSRDECVVGLNSDVTWQSFRSRCIDSERELSRANLDVYTQRDAVSVEFNGITYDFLRDTTKSDVFHNGEAPVDSDVLFEDDVHALAAGARGAVRAGGARGRVQDPPRGAAHRRGRSGARGHAPHLELRRDRPGVALDHAAAHRRARVRGRRAGSATSSRRSATSMAACPRRSARRWTRASRTPCS